MKKPPHLNRRQRALLLQVRKKLTECERLLQRAIRALKGKP